MPATPHPSIRTVAVIGTGTIGASWTALFSGHGLDVIASDPAAAMREMNGRETSPSAP